MNNTKFLNRFSTSFEVVNQQGGMFIKPGLLWTKWYALGTTDMSNTKDKARTRSEVGGDVKACLFISKLSGECHGEFKHSLATAYASGTNNYPGTIGDATSWAPNYLRMV